MLKQRLSAESERSLHLNEYYNSRIEKYETLQLSILKLLYSFVENWRPQSINRYNVANTANVTVTKINGHSLKTVQVIP